MNEREVRRIQAKRRAKARAEAEEYSHRISESSTHSREESLTGYESGQRRTRNLNKKRKTNKNNRLRRRRLRRRRRSYIQRVKDYFWYRRYRLPIIAVILVLIVSILTVVNHRPKQKAQTTEKDHDYKVVNQTVKLNNEWYNGRALIQDVQTREIYIPARELKEGLGGNVSLKNADVITNENVKYVAMSTLHKKIGVNVRMTDDNIYYIDNFPDLDYSWVEENRMIAHSMGGVDDKKYLNCKEGFDKAYEDGYRVFEGDIRLTTDGVPVLMHDWKKFRKMAKNFKQNSKPFDYANFQAALLYGKYHPLSVEDVAKLMQTHKDFYLVMDTKVTEANEAKKLYDAFIKTVSKVDPKLLDRMIPQIYNDEMINVTFNAYEWKSAIYTLYRQDQMASNLSTFENAYSAGIRAFAMNTGDYDATLVQQVYDIDGWVYMHTFNDKEDVDEILKKTAVYGFYSDFLPSNAVDKYKYPPDLD